MNVAGLPGPAFVLADLRRADIAAVAALDARSFLRPWSAEVFDRELETPHSRIVVAREATSGEVVGYACRWLTAGELQIHNVAVEPDWRRRGIARLLVVALLDEGRLGGAARALLEVRFDNAPALALYRSLGFRSNGVRRDYYGAGQDAILMELEL